jgi:type II secretory pathway pseudopilin PulG
MADAVYSGGSTARASFTLIEMLTVVVIILILVGLLLSGVYAVKNQGHRTRCRHDVNQLTQAWTQYLLEYKRFPTVTVSRMDSTAVTILRGWPSNANNARSICFMDLGTNTTYFCDPWGKRNSVTGAYWVLLDTNLDNYVTIGSTDIYVSVAIWSDGPDRQFGTADDVASWKR